MEVFQRDDVYAIGRFYGSIYSLVGDNYVLGLILNM